MKSCKLNRKFFARSTLQVARELLGKFLVRKIGQRQIVAMITETEAYCGPNDLASHASRGRTPRTKVMFGPPGRAYIYLIYGMYHCLNIVTEKEGYPAAVLIRAAIQDTKCQIQNTKLDGPGKICKYLAINRTLNNENLTTSRQLWLEDRGIVINPHRIRRTPRIGVDYAGKYKDKKWRFVLKSSYK